MSSKTLETGNVTLSKKIKKYYKLFPFLIPSLILVIVFAYLPMVGTLIAFKKDMNTTLYGVFEGFSRATWTFDNFKNMFTDVTFILAIKNTLLINFAKILIVFPLTIMLAIFLSEIKSKFTVMIVLIILCLPNFLSWSVTIGMWQGFLDETNGAVNNILLNLKLIDEPFWVFGSNALFKPLVIFFATWKGIGWSSIIFYTAIVAIDKTFYEAALIDGANRITIVFKITLPMILPTIALMLVLNITYFLDAGFEQVFAMMNGVTHDDQQILGTYLYEISMSYGSDKSMATAMGVFNGAVALILMLVGNAVVKKTLNKSLW
jgi:putative aldouronate transport system permease protein